MNKPSNIRYLEPTVVPAHPGYRVAILGWKGDDTDGSDPASPSDPTDPADLWVAYYDVIAWLVRPMIKMVPGYEEISSTSVFAVTIDGLIEQAGSYVVSPSGTWTEQGIADFDNELEARKAYIESRRQSRATRS